MQNHIQTLVKEFFRKDALEEVSVHELRQFTEEHPYSAAGQLLYARKLQQTGDTLFQDQAERSTLYFHNPVWSRWVLENHSQQTERKPLERIIHPPATTNAEEAVLPEPEKTAPEIAMETIAHTIPVEPSPPSEEIPAPAEPAVKNPVPVSEIANDTPAQAGAPSNGEEAGKPATIAEDDLPFESYHTIDYFASQGIKLKLEDLPKDKLGQQLKSFTEWLRTMKKIAPTENSSALDELTHQAIQQIAEHSVAGKEIITEAMAEVWAKQGHREKAAAIYEKLSLLNPAKSSYFAGKIEQLKAV